MSSRLVQTASTRALFSALFLVAALFAANSTARPAPEAKVLNHVVLFKFSPDATPEKIKQVEDAFRALPSKITEIRSFEWGTNVSHEGLSDGFTHCFHLTFASEKDRDAYLVHPAHKAFGEMLGSSLAKVTVVDFWAQK
ncbi:MAG TPA: Dabb family protein [Dongiaceae bacterium]|nr:Dabb family protein [Dongiaceae bacterium]